MIRWLALALVLAAAGQARAQDGASVYQRGAGLSARLGSAQGAALPAGRLTCAGCHGPDGRGGAEGGAQPAPGIGWARLSAPGPDRPAYDRAGFLRLLEQGITPSGRVISGRMPRFSAPAPVIDALIGHLAALDGQEGLGLGADSIAVTLPAHPPARAAALAAIAAFNAEGGAYGRRIVPAAPAFLDLEAVLSELLPRLRAAEEARLQALLREDPGLRRMSGGPADRVAGTLDEIGPELPALAARHVQPVVVGPGPEAMDWAVRDHATGEAAHAYAAIRAALELLRQQGRQPGRTRFGEELRRLDAAALVDVYGRP
ncbi:MAG: hypothetical protein QM682_04715 [Paracoccus sp. (in: a-proteobacteria)]|uniref:hypothetical protein n=1 Tax=Paracoccus sp. TaxID=267 RepID=UPI0039E39884